MAKRKVTFEIDTHRKAEGGWVAQILVDGVVIIEEDGPASEGQAIANVQSSFAIHLRRAIDIVVKSRS